MKQGCPGRNTMRVKFSLCLAICIIVSSCALSSCADKTPESTPGQTTDLTSAVTTRPNIDGIDATGQYFGQEPPGMIPEIFAPGFICTSEDMEYACTFTPDGKEFYYTVRKNKTGESMIMMSRWINGRWTTPEKLNIPGAESCMEPHITSQGDTIYFGAEIKTAADVVESGIWQMKRTGSEWKDLSHVTDGMYVSTSQNGSIYLTDIDHTGAIVKIPYDGSKFSEPVKLAGGPNSPVFGIHPCIAPDESFIIFDCRRADGYGGEGDLYVSFNNGDGTWSDGFNLGSEINSAGIEFCASLSPDGKYLFYMKDYDIYWVDIKVIDKFRTVREQSNQ
jgi:hypothetical protein